ncbi:MAG TPA: cytochrome c oxidase subunit II [Polyangiaceae bacterium]|nr:cytochrome c oxidase subunit II [Polyangiaceae bacterium]
MRSPVGAFSFVAAAALALSSCSGVQSALAPAGQQAEHLARIFWWMTGGTLAIWLLVIGIALYAAYTPARKDLVGARRLVVWGGVIVPTVVLTLVLCFGLALIPRFVDPAAPSDLSVHVTGEQYWWRVKYPRAGAAPLELANEIRLPVGAEVDFLLDSTDVIHSFWIPSLGGKVDMIPGRQTRLRLSPRRTGTFRGVCAEYCGASHAWMAFSVVVQERAEFERWLERQAAPARTPSEGLAREGRDVFTANGCGACHTLRGTLSSGVVGPDLTHVGGRESLAAGVLPNHEAGFGRWVVETDRLKPGVHMPAFGMLAAHELRALAAYLESLE